MSVPTVSKVINGRSDVSADTRRRVETAIREHGYQRSPGSRPRTPLLEVIFHELESEWALEIVRGVERVAGQHHLAVVLTEMQGRRSPGRGWIEGVLARRPTGVIAVFSDLSEIDAGAARDPRHPVRRRRPDRRAAPRHAVDRSDQLERRPDRDSPPAWASATGGSASSAGRSGSCAAAPASTATARRWTRPASRSTRTSSATASSTSRRASTGDGRCCACKDRPTAIFAGNDLQALGVYQAAREARLHIPEDLSVVGFDDLPVAQWVGPPLTTVRQPLMDMAAAAAEMVVAMANGETPTQTRVELATELVVRESTAPPSG